jgi:tRNA threonylcarbamoyladenosine biosynthesis protein TsaB
MSPEPGPTANVSVPPTTLAIDTTAGRCSVALFGRHGLVRRAEPMVHGHSRYVLDMVGAVMREAGVTPAGVEVIGFGSGPGSFTGLRIACGVAQGLGFGWGRPLVAVDAMRTLALQAADAARVARAPAAAVVLVCLDLRMGEVCHAAFALEPDDPPDHVPDPIEGPALGAPAAAIAAFERVADARGGVLWLAGDGFDAHAPLAAWAARDRAIRAPGAVQPDAAAVARLAATGLRAGRGVDAAQAAPTYLRDKVALDVGEQAALRASRAAAGVAR